jgi:flagellar biosynthetic protein FliP
MAGFAGVLTALGFVLAALGGALVLLRRLPGGARAGGRLPMEVLQRVALGPKQGIAVVKVGSRVVAVSVGEGGVRTLFDVDPAEVRDAAPLAAVPPRVADFARGLERRLRTAARTAAVLAVLALGVAPAGALAQAAPTAAEVARPGAVRPVAQAPDADPVVSRLSPQVDLRVGEGEGGLRLSGAVGVVVMMGLLSVLPTLVLLMTSFTRIFVVLSFLKQALGTQSAPPAHLVAALSLLLTGFVMQPTLSEAHRVAFEPWMEGRIDQAQMLSVGVKPFREFMLAQTRDRDIETFLEMHRAEVRPATAEEIPLVVLTSAFVVSELKTAFQIGAFIFLPFIVIDVVVSSVLMSMGMFMLPPAMISLPFKLLLFVLADGWTLIVQSLVQSFR